MDLLLQLSEPTLSTSSLSVLLAAPRQKTIVPSNWKPGDAISPELFASLLNSIRPPKIEVKKPIVLVPPSPPLTTPTTSNGNTNKGKKRRQPDVANEAFHPKREETEEVKAAQQKAEHSRAVHLYLEVNPDVPKCKECLLNHHNESFDAVGDNLREEGGAYVCDDCASSFGVVFDRALPQQHHDVLLVNDDRVHASVDPIQKRVVVDTSNNNNDVEGKEEIKFVTREITRLHTGISGGPDQLQRDHHRIGDDKSCMNDIALMKLKSNIMNILTHLGRGEYEPLVSRCMQLADRFMAVSTSQKQAIKSGVGPLASACVIRAGNEQALGIRAKDLAFVMCEQAKINRWVVWNKRMMDLLRLPKLNRSTVLNGFVNKFTATYQQAPYAGLTKGELKMIQAIMAFVTFMRELGDLLPPVQVNGYPYANEEVTATIKWATKYLRPSKTLRPKAIGIKRSDGKIKRGKSAIPSGNRDYKWVKPLVAIGTEILDSKQGETPGGRFAMWTDRIKSKHAKVLLASPGSSSQQQKNEDSASEWALNRVHPPTIAVGILYVVTQLRKPRPTTASKKGNKVVDPIRTVGRSRSEAPTQLYRMTQQEAEAVSRVHKVGLTQVQKWIRDMYYCFMA